MDPRESRFLASQAERLADNKRHQMSVRRNHHQHEANDDYFPIQSSSRSRIDFFADDTTTPDDEDDDNRVSRKKVEGQKFWVNFRKSCSELQSQIDSLLVTPYDKDDNRATATCGERISKCEIDAKKAYYAIAARRIEGRNKLDSILANVRLLQRHCLSSSVMSSCAAATTTTTQLLLNTIIQTPMPEMTLTDTRLISEEIDRLLKSIDDVREIISPKEKFVFKRYRKAIEEKTKRMLSGDSSDSVLLGDVDAPSTDLEPNLIVDGDDDAHKEIQARAAFNHDDDGGVLENKSDCIIEIFSDGSIKVNESTQSQIQYYSRPRLPDALHPPKCNSSEYTKATTPITTLPSTPGSNMSYLLQNLTNVTILLHGSRPSLHLTNIQNCHIYATEPTLGPVHVTNCHSSEIRCSCYQLRIHDSINVRFGVWVRSGPIIENCKEMVFVGNYYYIKDHECSEEGVGDKNGVGENMFWDVKDFNWLRTLRKSPNFVVIAECNREDEDIVKAGGDDKKVERFASGDAGAGVNVAEIVPSHEQEQDSEDEL